MDILFTTHLLNGLLMMGMPILLGIYLTHRFHLGWRLWLIGAAGFIISQVLHIPFLNLANRFIQGSLLAGQSDTFKLVFNAIYLGLAAGLFEEITRYLVMRWWVKDKRSWRSGVLLGAGHGGAEAFILGALVFYSFIQMVAYRHADLSKLVPASQLALAQQQITAYWTATWYDSLLGAVERFFTIPIQICFGVMVMQVFTRRNYLWLGFAILWHAIIDGTVIYLSGMLGTLPGKNYILEGIVAVFWLISVGILFALRQPEPVVEPPLPHPPLAPGQLSLVETPETPENLDNTRFNS